MLQSRVREIDRSRVEDQHNGIASKPILEGRRHTTGHTSPDLIDSPGEELTDLARNDPRFTLRTTLTGDSAPGWSGRVGRIDLPAVQALLEGLGGVADSFVCGSAGFVEAASALLLQAGQPGDAIRTERFGPTGT